MQDENGSVRRLELFSGGLEMPCQDRRFIDPAVRKESIRRLGVRPILASQWDGLPEPAGQLPNKLPESPAQPRVTKPAASQFLVESLRCPARLETAGAPLNLWAIKRFAGRLQRDNVFNFPWWDDLVTGIPKPIIQNGYIPAPETPGLGVALNEEAVKQHLRVPGYFEPTPHYDKFINDDFRPAGAYPHTDEFGKPVAGRQRNLRLLGREIRARFSIGVYCAHPKG
jgi:hypothetical protein